MTFIVQIPVYKVPLSVTTDRRVYNRWRESRGFKPIHPASAGNAGWIEYKGDEFFTMYIPLATSPGAIAHEYLHVAGYILESRGVPYGPNPDNDEALAYLLEFLVNQVHRKLKCSQRRFVANKGRKRLFKKQSSRT